MVIQVEEKRPPCEVDTQKRESPIKQWTWPTPLDLLLKQEVDAPLVLALLPADSTAVLWASSYNSSDEILLQRTPMEKTDSTGLLMSNKVQYRPAEKHPRKQQAAIVLCLLLEHYLSLQNYHPSSPRLLPSNFSSSFLSSPALSRSPACVFCGWKSVSPSLYHCHCPLSCCQDRSFSFFTVFLFLCRLFVLFLLCLSLTALLSSLLLSLLQHSAFFRLPSSSFFFFFFFFFREDFLERFDMLASLPDLDFFILLLPVFFEPLDSLQK